MISRTHAIKAIRSNSDYQDGKHICACGATATTSAGFDYHLDVDCLMVKRQAMEEAVDQAYERNRLGL